MSTIDFSVARKHLETNVCAFYRTDILTKSTMRVSPTKIPQPKQTFEKFVCGLLEGN